MSKNSKQCHLILNKYSALRMSLTLCLLVSFANIFTNRLDPDQARKCSGSKPFDKEALAIIGRVFSVVEMITKTKFINCPNVFKSGMCR